MTTEKPEQDEKSKDEVVVRELTKTLVKAVTAVVPYSAYPERLYHYTDAVGLAGIVEKRNLWATNTQHLNDNDEVKYGLRMLREALEAGKEYFESKATKALMDVLLASAFPLSGREADQYIASFCTEDDLLSQWRGYGLHGSGYALGFDSKLLVETTSAHLVEVVYERDRQVDRIIEAVKAIVPKYEELRSSRNGEALSKFDEWAPLIVSFNLWNIAQAFKKSGWGEEREWRLVVDRYDNGNSLADEHLKFRNRGAELIPYIELALGTEQKTGLSGLLAYGDYQETFPLKSIRMGPRIDPERGERSLRLFLKKAQLRDIEIRQSELNFHY